MGNKKLTKLLSSERLRTSTVIKDPNDARNPFDNDFSRMVLSSYVRRLQDKAQVFPLEKSDFVRTRLTHSLEVSCFARSLGLGIEKFLLEKEEIAPETQGYIPSILQTAGLIHDIGNPPFGHFGEAAISRFFKSLNENTPKIEGYSDEIAQQTRRIFNKLTREQQEDFCQFDGNVQGFRILTKLGLAKDDYSYNLCIATLATIIKYPYDSTKGNQRDKEISRKKFGYFQSEKDRYEKIIKELNLPEGQRHPLVFLLEAADDIAYSVSDLEDGYKLGCIMIEDIESINALLPEKDRIHEEGSDSTIGNDIFVQSVRIKTQSKMLQDCTKAFIDNYSEIMDGSFNEELISRSDSRDLREKCKDLGNKNFEDKRVLRRELVGDKVITYFLNLFIGAFFSEGVGNPRSKEAKILKLIPDNYLSQELKEELKKEIREVSKTTQGKEQKRSENTEIFYKAFMAVVDFISGMTDTYALTLYQELTGQIIS